MYMNGWPWPLKKNYANLIFILFYIRLSVRSIFFTFFLFLFLSMFSYCAYGFLPKSNLTWVTLTKKNSPFSIYLDNSSMYQSLKFAQQINSPLNPPTPHLLYAIFIARLPPVLSLNHPIQDVFVFFNLNSIRVLSLIKLSLKLKEQ